MLPEELSLLAASMGEPPFRGKQLFSWIQARGVVDPSAMTNLSKAFRERVASVDLAWPARIGQALRAADGTRKLEIVLRDGCAVETVLIPERDKLTQCLSTQVGCAVHCAFCRSGHNGLARNLTAGEIVAQVHLARAAYLPEETLRNVVLMGVGEPLHNLENVLRAVAVLEHADGANLSSRRVTLSTVGIPRGIDRLGEATHGRVALAISLHAADDDTRAFLVPGAKAGVAEIVEALRRYPLPSRRRFTIEYVMVKGVNDSDGAARRLAKLLAPLKVKVNLLPLNPHDLTDLMAPDDDRVAAFQQILIDKGLSVFLRKRRGADIGAACGQLLAVRPSS